MYLENIYFVWIFTFSFNKFKVDNSKISFYITAFIL